MKVCIFSSFSVFQQNLFLIMVLRQKELCSACNPPLASTNFLFALMKTLPYLYLKYLLNCTCCILHCILKSETRQYSRALCFFLFLKNNHMEKEISALMLGY